MPRVASDDESVTAVRVSLARSGGTRRLCVRLPADTALESRIESGSCDALALDDGDLIRLVIDRSTYHAQVVVDTEGRLLRGAFDDRRRARTSGEGQNRLTEWLDASDREPGDSVVLDVIVPGKQYGLRLPGERTVYDAVRGPRSSLADIAASLDE